MTETQQKTRGRPRSEDARRHPLSFRVNDDSREKMLAVAEASGLSLAQEIERRLELTLRQEREALSEPAAFLGEYVKLATAMIERQTGKSWTEDLDTYQTVLKAIGAFMFNNHPPVTGAIAQELQQAAAKIDQTKLAVTAAEGTDEEFFAKVDYKAAVKEFNAMKERYNSNLEANAAMGEGVAEDLGKLFSLRLSAKG